MPTEPQEAASTARRMFERLNARDLDGLAALQHDDVVDDFVAVGAYRGKAAVRAFFEELFAAFPDFHLEVEQIIAGGSNAVVQWRSSGTFTAGSFQGVAANGKHVEIRGVDVMSFDGGLLRANTIYYDGAGFARSVGLLPAQRSTGEKALFAAFNAVTSARKLLHL